MKRIALLAAALSLAAGAAMAATPGKTAATTPPTAVAHQSDRAANRETRALNLLEAKGYASFTNFRRDGKDFTASVTQNGRTMNLLVDPQNGQITTTG